MRGVPPHSSAFLRVHAAFRSCVPPPEAAAGKAAGGQGATAGVDRAKVSNVSNQVEVQSESIDAESRSNIFEENARHSNNAKSVA